MIQSRISKFLIVGGITLCINLSLLYTLTEYLKMQYLLSSAVAFVGAWVFNFVSHKFWTFNHEQTYNVHLQAFSHFVLLFLNLGINTAIIYVLVNYVHVWYVFAQAIATCLIAVESFLLLSFFIFKESKQQ